MPADLMTLVSIAMQERIGRALLGVLGAPPPPPQEGQCGGVDPGQGSRGGGGGKPRKGGVWIFEE